jgi:hypothetical protein
VFSLSELFFYAVCPWCCWPKGEIETKTETARSIENRRDGQNLALGNSREPPASNR